MHPQELKIDDFTYDLPDSHIAYHPADPKDAARLLIYRRGELSDDTYRNIATQVPHDTVLIFNDTKVIKSRLLFPRETGSVIEIFCLEPYGEDLNYEEELHLQGTATWKCLIGKVQKWKEPTLCKTFDFNGEEVILEAEIAERRADGFVVKFTWKPADLPFGSVLNHAGVMPLPPYIKRKAETADEATYQTLYSEHEGSVAAPTAGLHFTQNIFNDLRKQGIETLFTTLHVGAGTFMPVKSETMEGHAMHGEYLNITTGFLESLIQAGKRPLIPVGTTSMRTLESIYWMGNKILNHPDVQPSALKVHQWEPYEKAPTHPPGEAVKALLGWMKNRGLYHLSVETEIIIAPPYRFRLAQGMVTNFHQPKSTLLLLVAALIGEDWHRVYDHALRENFRFLSYGDGCLLLPFPPHKSAN